MTEERKQHWFRAVVAALLMLGFLTAMSAVETLHAGVFARGCCTTEDCGVLDYPYVECTVGEPCSNSNFPYCCDIPCPS
jgi:hypothetical protein